VLDMRVRADESIGYAHALVRLTATRTDGTAFTDTLRVTTGYRDTGLRRLIGHEHAVSLKEA
jgi:ketosteroid isomerase-like protein